MKQDLQSNETYTAVRKANKKTQWVISDKSTRKGKI